LDVEVLTVFEYLEVTVFEYLEVTVFEYLEVTLIILGDDSTRGEYSRENLQYIVLGKQYYTIVRKENYSIERKTTV